MRIAFVSDAAYPWHFGGIEVLEHTEAKELAKSHEVHFFSMQWPGMRRTFRREGITYHAFHRVTQKRFYRHERRSIREALAFSASLFKLFPYKFDFVIANEFPVLHLPILKLYCALRGCKLILDVHEVWGKDYWTRYLGALPGTLANSYASTFLTVADAYIANSSVTRSNLISAGVDGRRIRVFSPVLDDRFISGIRAGKSSRSIIFWGRLIKEKRLYRWILTVDKIRRKVKGLRAIIIGDGPERQGIAAMIRSLGLGGVIEMRHSYSDSRRRALFRAVKEAGLLLHMSEREGLSMIALESIALGTPVLLPSYSPVPKEVRGMCVVAKESELATVAARILNSGDKGKYIKNRAGLKDFYISNISGTYSEIFRSLEK